MTDTEQSVFLIFFIIYYFLWGLISYWYFKIYKKDTKESWKLYIFFYGMRIRIAICGGLAICTTQIYLYGTIGTIK